MLLDHVSQSITDEILTNFSQRLYNSDFIIDRHDWTEHGGGSDGLFQKLQINETAG